jgi:hypothetical protein
VRLSLPRIAGSNKYANIFAQWIGYQLSR